MEGRSGVHSRPFGWPFIINTVQHRMGMWVGRPTYERAVAFVIGFDAAQAESINPRLQARVSERYNSGSIAWPSALLAEAIGKDAQRPRDLGPLSPEQDARAINLLVRELRATLGGKDESAG